MLLAKTYLIPTLLYSCEIFANCDTISNRKINVAYNNIARYVFNIKHFDHISIYSKEMLGMSLNNFLNFRPITLIHKIISNKEPTYLYHKLTFTKSNRINQIIHKKYKYLLSERQFIPFATRIWNSLPKNIRNIGNHVQFKSRLKMYFSMLQ